MSGLPGTLPGPMDDGLSLLQGGGLPGYHHLMPSAYANANFLSPPTSTATLAHNFLDSATPTSSYGHHQQQHQQQQQQHQQYLESSLLLASQPLLRPQSLHHQLATLVQPGSNLSSLVQPGSSLSSLVQPSLPLNLNYLNFSLLNSLGPLQAQGIKVKQAPQTFSKRYRN